MQSNPIQSNPLPSTPIHSYPSIPIFQSTHAISHEQRRNKKETKFPGAAPLPVPVPHQPKKKHTLELEKKNESLPKIKEEKKRGKKILYSTVSFHDMFPRLR